MFSYEEHFFNRLRANSPCSSVAFKEHYIKIWKEYAITSCSWIFFVKFDCAHHNNKALCPKCINITSKLWRAIVPPWHNHLKQLYASSFKYTNKDSIMYIKMGQ